MVMSNDAIVCSVRYTHTRTHAHTHTHTHILEVRWKTRRHEVALKK